MISRESLFTRRITSIPSCLYALLFALLTLSASGVRAQVFTPIIDDYACAQFSNGSQYLTRIYGSGFLLVKVTEVRKYYNTERKILRQRIALLNEKLGAFRSSRLAKTKLIKVTNQTISKIFKDGSVGKLPSELPPDEAELQVDNIIQQLNERDRNLVAAGALISECLSGVNPKTGRGKSISAVVEPIALASSNTIYGGFVIYSSKLGKSGYNVCLKFIYPDGTVGRLYTGFGDDYLCGTGTLKFEGILQSECKKVLPRGQVGYVIQKRTFAFTSLPDRSTAELLQDMKLQVRQDQPVVGVMQFPASLSRDASVRACESY